MYLLQIIGLGLRHHKLKRFDTLYTVPNPPCPSLLASLKEAVALSRVEYLKFKLLWLRFFTNFSASSKIKKQDWMYATRSISHASWLRNKLYYRFVMIFQTSSFPCNDPPLPDINSNNNPTYEKSCSTHSHNHIHYNSPCTIEVSYNSKKTKW